METDLNIPTSNFRYRKEKRDMVIKKLYKILDEFQTPKFDIEYSIYSKICEFLEKELSGRRLPLDSELFYEKTAFALGELDGKCTLLGWEGLNYGPTFSARDKNGNLISNPDIEHISPQMIDYWEKRSNEVKNPILQQQYAGLVWDFSKKIKQQNPDIKYAQRFIDSVQKLVELDTKGSLLQRKLKKSLGIAISINNKKRISFIKDAIINYEDTHSENSKAGTWGYSYDWLVTDKDLSQKVTLTTKEEKKIITDLERRLTVLSDKKSSLFDHHSVECLATMLAPYYKKASDMKSMKRVLLVYRDVFLSAPLPLLAGATLLEKVRQVLFQYGLSEEAKQMEPEIRRFETESLKEFQKHETRISIPKKVISDYLKALDNKKLSEALGYVAVCNIPDEELSKQTVLKVSKEHPLQFHVNQNIMDYTGRTVGNIRPIEEDLEGHTIKQMSQDIKFKTVVVDLGLNHLIKNQSLNADLMSEYLLKSPFFPEEHHQIIKQGVTSFFQENYISSISVLVPQVETAMRTLITQIGGEIYQSSSNHEKEGFKLRPLGTLLRDQKFIHFFKQFDNVKISNIPIYFQVLLTDPRGMNLRNDFCHGHFPASYFHRTTAVCIIHVLLIFSIFKKEE